MLEEPVGPLIRTLAGPNILSMLVTSIYNMADTYFVSQINTSASGAVGIVFSAMALIQAAGFTVGTGSGAMTARLLGSNQRQRANETASSGVLLALVFGVLIAAVGLLNLDELIWLLGSTETIHPYAAEYAFYILLGAPVMTLSFTMSNLLRWQGRANLAAVGLTIGGVLNMILDPIFIFSMGMGIGGAGAATLLSQMISMSILASMFLRKKGDVRLHPAYISKSPHTYITILKQGAPSFFRQGVTSFAAMATNYNARIYGDAAVAALAIVSKVFMVINSITIGFGQGFQPVLGFNYGAGRKDRVKEAVVYSIRFVTIILTAAAVLGFAFAPQIIGAFRDDPLVVSSGVRAFRYQCLTMPLGAVIVFSNMLFQSLGKAFRATTLAVSRQGSYIPLVFFFTWRFGLGGLEASQALADFTAFVLAAVVLTHYFKTEFQTEEQTE